MYARHWRRHGVSPGQGGQRRARWVSKEATFELAQVEQERVEVPSAERRVGRLALAALTPRRVGLERRAGRLSEKAPLKLAEMKHERLDVPSRERGVRGLPLPRLAVRRRACRGIGESGRSDESERCGTRSRRKRDPVHDEPPVEPMSSAWACSL